MYLNSIFLQKNLKIFGSSIFLIEYDLSFYIISTFVIINESLFAHVYSCLVNNQQSIKCKNVGAMHFIYYINRLTAAKVDSIYLGA